MKRERVAAFLEAESTLALATVTGDGAARVTPLFYLARGLQLYWFSAASSEHSQSLKINPACAVTIYGRTAEWKEIRGVQMRGVASVVEKREVRRDVMEAYCARFHLGKVFEAAMAKSRLYCFEPEWVRYIDNARGFGYKFELSC